MSEARLAELHATVLRLVVEQGYDNLTMDQVATAAHSSKATLYRQWGSKEALVVDALGTLFSIVPEVPDTGTVRGDLHALVEHGGKPAIEMPLVGAILHAGRTNPDLAAGVRDTIVATQRHAFEVVVERGVERGEVAADNPARDLVLLMLAGPALLRGVVDGKEPDDAYVIGYIDAVVLPALGLTPATS